VATVGVRELKNRLSYYLARVREGEQVVVTDRGQEIAVISPSPEDETLRVLRRLRAEGIISWNGQRFTAPPNPVPGRGRPTSEMVIEDRR